MFDIFEIVLCREFTHDEHETKDILFLCYMFLKIVANEMKNKRNYITFDMSKNFIEDDH